MMGKRILVVGEGAREHALCWALARSNQVEKVYCAPGNGGTSSIATNVLIKVTDFDGLLSLAVGERIDLVVVGPELPLALGLADRLRAGGLRVYGPSQAAARIESSKSFAKEVMQEAGVPTAAGRSFDDFESACDFIRRHPRPLVVKADGLAAAKGVTVPASQDEAIAAVRAAMVDRLFGDSGARVILEEQLSGQEVSVMAVCSGRDFVLLPPACDYKRALDEDKGPNTGGMGAYSPTRLLHEADLRSIGDQIIQPTLAWLAESGSPFVGTLYAGLMLTEQGPMALEFNARFGDPETQVALPNLSVDIFELLSAAAAGSLGLNGSILSSQGFSCGVVLASGGYPGSYQTGREISGLERLEKDTLVFHAGTTVADSRIVTAGGRVMTVARSEQSMRTARDKVYQEIDKIKFDNMHYRRDIAAREV